VKSKVEKILGRHFPEQAWRITRPRSGLQKEAYIVQSERHKLFLKFDADTPAWQRLAEIGAAPPLIGTGVYDRRPYVIQRFMEGEHPDRRWFTQNITLLAEFIHRYQTDRPLKEILTTSPGQSYAEHVWREVGTLESALNRTGSRRFNSDRFRQGFSLFREQARQLEAVPLMPVHADPSPGNFLVTKHGITMLDWDEVLLSDPMRDVGPVVWWYLPQDRWQAFFDLYGAPLDRSRIFWWAARRSVEIALWFDEREANDAARTFLDDFYLTVQHQENPQVASYA